MITAEVATARCVQPRTEVPMKAEISHMPLMRINAPEFYRDWEFIAWLNNPEQNQATWHRKGKAAGEYSDLFFIVDPPEGSDSDMPEHIWNQILEACEDAVGLHQACFVWLTNLMECP